MKKDLSELRREYALGALTKASVEPDPFKQFGRWMHEAVEAQLSDPNAMILATVGPDAMPSARVVLLKSFDVNGFVFYTNYLSVKGLHLERNPQAALVFFWQALERQVRIQGTVTKTSREDSEAYFRSRPLGSRLSALASRQSQVVEGRKPLENRFEALAEKFADGDIPIPQHWGGYRLAPLALEFWQGRESRLHDRLRYQRHDGGDWLIERLEP